MNTMVEQPSMRGEPARYGTVARTLHWVLAMALLGQIAFGFLLDDIAPRGTPARAGVINLHKSMGIVLGLLIAARLAWRLAHAPPPWPRTLAAWQLRAAVWCHRALYVCMVVMPVSAYVASNFSKHGIMFFGNRLAPWGPDFPAAYAFFNGIHVATAWMFCALIGAHVAAALKHKLIDRDTVFSRMWPMLHRPNSAIDGTQ